MANKPLQDVRILDFTQMLPGGMCTQHLGDLGADVLKIEPAGHGEAGRGPAGSPPTHYFFTTNRNKRSLAINLRAPGATEVVLKLAAKADVLIEGFRPGVMARLGLGYEAVKAVNPKIVYCSITGYGQDGPLSTLGGHDINYQSYAGVLEQSALAGGQPTPGNFQIADLAGGGLSSIMGILAALFDAQRSGQGRYVDVSMTDCAMALGAQNLASMHTRGATVAPGDDILSGGIPSYGTYETADGRFLAEGGIEHKFWHAFCMAIGREDLSASGWAMGKDNLAVRQQVADVIKGKTMSEWTEILAGVDGCVSPVLRVDEVLQHPNTKARHMVAEVESPDGQRFPYFAFPVKMSNFQFTVDRSPPALGQHNDEVLKSLGYGDAEIVKLKADGAV